MNWILWKSINLNKLVFLFKIKLSTDLIKKVSLNFHEYKVKNERVKNNLQHFVTTSLAFPWLAPCTFFVFLEKKYYFLKKILSYFLFGPRKSLIYRQYHRRRPIRVLFTIKQTKNNNIFFFSSVIPFRFSSLFFFFAPPDAIRVNFAYGAVH